MTSMPIRFFCRHCNQMIQIGAQMIGRTVVCPQCSERVIVPVQSVPQAEALYQFLKRKRMAEKTGPNTDSPRPITASAAPIRSPAISVQSKEQKQADEEQDLPFENLDADEVDRWIAEFWATNQPDGSEAASKRSIPMQSMELAEKPVVKPASILNDAVVTVRHRQTLALFRTWLLIVFLLGFIGGLCTYSFFAGLRKMPEITGSKKSVASSENIVTGKLFYRGFSDERVPDADAVVLFLPMDRIPPIPMSVEGIRSDTVPGNSDDMVNDAVLQIVEIDGLFGRTGADGVFSIPYKKAGRYLAVMISSHAKRQESNVDTTTIQELRRFFRNPQDLLGDFRFIREEYEFEQGKYIVRETF